MEEALPRRLASLATGTTSLSAPRGSAEAKTLSPVTTAEPWFAMYYRPFPPALTYQAATNYAQMCRFHIEYPSSGPYSHRATATWAESLDEEDREFWDDEWDMREQEVSGLFTDGRAAGSKVETVKSHYMLCSMMIISHCEDCQPLLFLDERCNCTLHGLFSKIWRCIPCTLMKETKCAILEQKDVSDL
jgi:hypothetical protein